MDNGESSYRRFLGGDESGFDELVEAYREPLIRFIDGFLHNLAESEDVAEETFMELIIHPKRYAFRSSFKTYIFSVARNKAVDRVRREKKLCREKAAEELADVAGEAIEEAFLRKERRELLHRALDAINAEYAAALRLMYFENMTCEEAARVLGKSTRQTSNIIYRAKLALRREMEREGFFYEKQ